MAEPNAITWTQLCDEVKRIFSSDSVNVDEVKELMASYKSNDDDWAQYSIWDPEVNYTRNLVEIVDGKYELIVLCWNTERGSPIHDHSNSHCFMKILDGTLEEIHYYWPKEGESQAIREKEHFLHSRDDVTYIEDSMGLHRVRNPSNVKGAVSLHLYSPPITKCQKFDDKNGDAQPVHCKFYSVKGKRCTCSK